ncbi:MAG TPA: fluoride efflux transporter CrcB [Thermodesulfobacteriota bacterium]|nr:fluoride efflux transporter CrcB [Thermodesulfobacteriota bacterium]
MINLLLVGAGGFIGSGFRYVCGKTVHALLQQYPWFPFGTLTVNVIGCLLIGLLAGLSESRHLFSPEARLFVFAGFLGGFTTFSSFGYETFVLARDVQASAALVNVALQLILGLGAVWLGNILSRLI